MHGPLQHYATSDVPAARKLAYWNDLSGEAYAGSTVECRPDFHGRMWSWTIGGLRMLRPQTEACRVTRNAAEDDSGKIILHLQHRGGGRYRQHRRAVDLTAAAGDMVMCSSSEGYTIDLTAHDTLAVEFSRDAVPLPPALVDRRIGTVVDGRRAEVRLLHDFLLSLWRQVRWQGDTLSEAHEIDTVFLSLVALALGEGATERADSSGNRMEQVAKIVAARHAEPDFGSSELAAEAGLSLRALQKACARSGTTPTGLIQAARLDCAAERLAVDPEASVTDIAFEHGFGDSAYFSRCFRQRFGLSPQQWRRRI